MMRNLTLTAPEICVNLLGRLPRLHNFTWWYLGPNALKCAYSRFQETVQNFFMIY